MVQPGTFSSSRRLQHRRPRIESSTRLDERSPTGEPEFAYRFDKIHTMAVTEAARLIRRGRLRPTKLGYRCSMAIRHATFNPSHTHCAMASGMIANGTDSRAAKAG